MQNAKEQKKVAKTKNQKPKSRTSRNTTVAGPETEIKGGIRTVPRGQFWPSWQAGNEKIEEISKHQKSKTEKSKIEKHHSGWAGNGPKGWHRGTSQGSVLAVLARG